MTGGNILFLLPASPPLSLPVPALGEVREFNFFSFFCKMRHTFKSVVNQKKKRKTHPHLRKLLKISLDFV